MTAEGDNRVLMMKIVKDMMTNIHKKLAVLPTLTLLSTASRRDENADITQIEFLHDLLKFREITLYNNLIRDIQVKTKEEKKSQY